MKWLFVTTRFPWPLMHGTWLRVYHLCRTLRARGDQVSLLSFAGSPQGQTEYSALGVDILAGVPGEPLTRGPGRAFAVNCPFDAKLAELVGQHASAYDVVVLSHLNALQYAVEAKQAGWVIADLVDDPFLEWGRRFWNDRRRWFENIRFRIGAFFTECAFLRHVNVVTFVSDIDAKNFSKRHRNVRVEVLSNGVDTRYLDASVSTNASMNAEGSVLFVGNMAHFPNAEAASYLATQVLPRIQQRCPRTRAVIAGCNPPESITKLSCNDIDVTGYVEDLRPYFQNAGTMVLPLRSGTGIKNKLLEAWATGTAVVATPLACQGVDARHGYNVWIGRTADELADGAAKVLSDPVLRRTLCENGLRSVRQRHVWEAIAERLRTELVADRVESSQ